MRLDCSPKFAWSVVAAALICLAVSSAAAQHKVAPGMRAPIPIRKVQPVVGPKQPAAPRLPKVEGPVAEFASRTSAVPFHAGLDLPPPEDLYRQNDDDVHAKSFGCVNCHQGVVDMHDKETVKLGCIDCHGGDATATTKQAAHVSPKFPDAWCSSANPVRGYTLLNHEDPAFIQFVNPGDLRVAHIACGQCHSREVLAVKKSMMTNGCMLWGAALYNNGSVPHKRARFGESYSTNGVSQRINNVWSEEEWPEHERDVHYRGMVPYLLPLPRFEISQPGNVLRIFELGGRFRPEVGIPEKGEEPGRPRTRLSNRGLGTENRTDPVFIGLQKTRLFDPTLNFMGTNDHPGDYRSSGCTSCHVIYANDRSPVNSGPYAKHGHLGMAAHELDPPGPQQYVKNIDPTIPKNESGHPIAHKFTSAIPTSQCIVCHIHPGTNVLNSYTGFMWWDNETDGHLMYPEEQKYPTSEEYANAQMSNPEEASVRGNWSNPQFLENITNLNTETKHTQFADFNGHGWVFRAVFKKNREGHLLDHKGDVVKTITNEKLQQAVSTPTDEEREIGKHLDDTPVHLMDIHLEKGMHCSDCHFNQDVHGNTKLYGEVRAAIEITCVDCHGTAQQSIPHQLQSQLAHGQALRMPTTGPAAPPKRVIPNSPIRAEHPGGHNLLALKTPFNKPRFEWRAETSELIQHSMVHAGRSWVVKQTADTITPTHPNYNPRSHQAKTIRWNDVGELAWGGMPDENEKIEGQCVAHQNNNINCISCHSSWNPSCFGCHLPQKANKKMPDLHAEGDVSRNLVSYNFQTLRDDVFMLARDGFASGNKINPARSSCAIHVTSYNNNRESIYTQQQTISGCGFSGIAFSTNVPHTVRGGSPNKVLAAGANETKQCSDCHLSKNNDNNAIMAQLLMQGTNYVNFIGKYCWVAAGEHGFEGVVVTERDEPQAVIGSTLHKDAFPDFFEKHLEEERVLKHAHEHPGKDISEQILQPFKKHEIHAIQARGEYLYAACGEGGLKVFDIAFIDHKGFAERITSAPVSPAGQRFFVRTANARHVAAPSTIAPDPTRVQLPENHEQPVHGIYGLIFVADEVEGLITVGAGTLLDGNPVNNFLERDLTFNPNGLLKGARFVNVVGTHVWVLCDCGWVIIDFNDPKKPEIRQIVGEDLLHEPTNVQVQFRYAFVTDHEGVKVFDVTDPINPVYVSKVPLEDAHNIYVARTYAYVACGKHGLVILNVTDPENPYVDQVYTADGCINDLHDVKLGITYTSEFAYLADGENGLRVLQLTSPETPGSSGFSPRPHPQLIATYKLPKEGHALAIAEGIDRDRAVDESGNQIAVFGRIGARPLNRDEQRRMYLRTDPVRHLRGQGQPWFVSDDPFDPIYQQSPLVNWKWNDKQEIARRPTYGPVQTKRTR